jgi:hypothetical protein
MSDSGVADPLAAETPAWAGSGDEPALAAAVEGGEAGEAPESSTSPVESGDGQEPEPDAGSGAEQSSDGFVDYGLGSAVPLSPADLGTLSSIGVEPSDGVGALRLLAVLVRILNRNQMIEPDQLREEIRESIAQGAAVAATPNGMESEGSSPDGSDAGASSAET